MYTSLPLSFTFWSKSTVTWHWFDHRWMAVKFSPINKHFYSCFLSVPQKVMPNLALNLKLCQGKRKKKNECNKLCLNKAARHELVHNYSSPYHFPIEKLQHTIHVYAILYVAHYKKKMCEHSFLHRNIIVSNIEKVLHSSMATLIAPSNHSPQEDAEALKKAFEGGIFTPFVVWIIFIHWS